MPPESDRLARWIGQNVVVDVESPYVFLGRLVEVDEQSLLLENADAHDLRDATVTRELYLIESHRHGINVNRGKVVIARRHVVCVSLFDDLIV